MENCCTIVLEMLLASYADTPGSPPEGPGLSVVSTFLEELFLEKSEPNIEDFFFLPLKSGSDPESASAQIQHSHNSASNRVTRFLTGSVIYSRELNCQNRKPVRTIHAQSRRSIRGAP